MILVHEVIVDSNQGTVKGYVETTCLGKQHLRTKAKIAYR